MVDYNYYLNIFKGNVIPSEEEFNIYSRKAINYILARVNVGKIKEDMYDCVCAISEAFLSEGDSKNYGVISEKIGSWSKTYANAHTQDKYKNSILHDYLFMKGYLYNGI